MFHSFPRHEVLKSVKSNVVLALGTLLLIGATATSVHAQEMTEFGFQKTPQQKAAELMAPQLVTPRIDALSSKVPECELLNRISTESIEKDGTRTRVIHYVIASNSNAHPDSCLRVEIDTACNRAEQAEKISIDFTSLTNGSFYRAGRTYRLSGVCVESTDPNDVYPTKSPGGNEVAFKRRRHFNMLIDWTEQSK